MKKLYSTILIALSMLAASQAVFTSCEKDIEQPYDELTLGRCLVPTNTEVKISNGQYLIFNWDATKGADKFVLELYSDAEMTASVWSKEVLPSELPYTVMVDADQTFWARVKGVDTNGKYADSKWADFGKKIETYAVKDPLFLTLAARDMNSLSFTWDKDPSVTHLTITPQDGETIEIPLSDAEIAAGAASISGLEPSTCYVVALWFKSANCGELSAWTTPDASAMTEVSNSAALLQAIADKAPQIFLSNNDEPYEIAMCDLNAPVKIYGSQGVNGSYPVIKGEFHITSAFTSGDFYAEGVAFDGNNEEFGFPIQLKNGGAIAAGTISLGSIVYKNCSISAYSKGLIYEWGQAFDLGELRYESCLISSNNTKGNGGDGLDLRNASSIGDLVIINSTITESFRTFIRLDAAVKVEKMHINNNTFLKVANLDVSTNNSGFFGVKVSTKPSEAEFKNNLVLYETLAVAEGKGGAALVGAQAASNLAADAFLTDIANNWYYNCAETFFNANCSSSAATAKGGGILTAEPCYNAESGIFNLTNTDLVIKKVGDPRWFVGYAVPPVNLTLAPIENAKTWNLSDVKLFKGNVATSVVKDNLLFRVKGNSMTIEDGMIKFSGASVKNTKNIPVDGNLEFLAKGPGSVIVKPANVGEEQGSHVIVSVDGSVRGGAAVNTASSKAQKIVIKDIVDTARVYISVSGPIAISQLAWSKDTLDVNTSLPSPEPKVSPEYISSGEASEAVVSWEAVPQASGYTVVFSGKSYNVDGCSYTIASDVVKFLDAGSYMISVYANPGAEDIYNSQSAAGKVALTIQPKGGAGQSSEFVVSSIDDLNNAISSGKTDITLAYSASPYELGTIELTTPLRLKGQIKDGKKTPVRVSFALSGEIGGSVILRDLDIDGTGASGAIFKEAAAVTADTVAVIGCNIHDNANALYDNSGKMASCVQYLIFNDILVENCSTGKDFIDMRNGCYHNVKIMNSTFANSCRTFIRTDAGSEINYLTVDKNSFYKVATNSTSKDNNGLFHVRSAAGTGMQDYRISNNLFYSIKITETPANPAGYPKFISKNAAALKPNTIANNYFYNIEEDQADYSWWTVNCSREDGLAGGGAIIASEPCKNPEKGDFTLVNAVAINAGVGDPRWNPASGSVPSSDITVSNVADLLTALSAGKKTITLAKGNYDLSSVADNPDVAAGVLSVSSSVNLIGQDGAKLIGGFKLVGSGIKSFSARNIEFSGAAETKIGNFIDVADASVDMNSIVLENCRISAYGNRLYSQSAAATVESASLDRLYVTGMGTGGDFFDVRKGTINAVKITNSTFANGIRTFMRIDAAVVCGAVTVSNNTFFNLCSADSKDNNGIFHVRATTIKDNPQNFKVSKNIFAGMHRAVEAPSQANGYPKLVSSNVASTVPSFSANYFYDVDTDEGFSFWTAREDMSAELACAGYGVIMTADPFKASASENFTLVNALAKSERIGDPRWLGASTPSGSAFAVKSVDELIQAISAGKTNVELAYGTYDFSASTDPAITTGVLGLSTPLSLSGKIRDGKKPVVKGGFKLSEGVSSFVLGNISFDGAESIGNMIELAGAAQIENVVVRQCEITGYSARFYYQSADTQSVGAVIFEDLLVDKMGTGGDFIDIRKGSANLLKVSNSTFSNGIRTFIRMDAAVNAGAVTVANNTFYNLCFVDSKDNNGIMHVRSTSCADILVKNNLFAAMHRASETPSQANGYPKIVSANKASRIPSFIANLYYDVDAAGDYNWWTVRETADMSEEIGVANGGAVLTETPFSSDPSAGKFNVKAACKGVGDPRW